MFLVIFTLNTVNIGYILYIAVYYILCVYLTQFYILQKNNDTNQIYKNYKAFRI
jgi:hypothetical protein